MVKCLGWPRDGEGCAPLQVAYSCNSRATHEDPSSCLDGLEIQLFQAWCIFPIQKHPKVLEAGVRSQVRAAVNTKIAQLTSWSMDIAARGTGPLRGFMGESLAGTPREHLMGAELALGWRTVGC